MIKVIVPFLFMGIIIYSVLHYITGTMLTEHARGIILIPKFPDPIPIRFQPHGVKF